MKKILQLLIFVFACKSQILGQSTLETEIIGTWHVTRPYDMGLILPDDKKKKLEEIQKLFLNSTFEIKKDHNFSLDCSVKEMKMRNKYWKLSAENSGVVVLEWKDKDQGKPLLMRITLLRKDEKYIFILEEMAFAFEMRKE